MNFENMHLADSIRTELNLQWKMKMLLYGRLTEVCLKWTIQAILSVQNRAKQC